MVWEHGPGGKVGLGVGGVVVGGCVVVRVFVVGGGGGIVVVSAAVDISVVGIAVVSFVVVLFTGTGVVCRKVVGFNVTGSCIVCCLVTWANEGAFGRVYVDG